MWSLMTDICRQMGVHGCTVPRPDQSEKDIVFPRPLAEKKHIFYHNKNFNQAG